MKLRSYAPKPLVIFSLEAYQMMQSIVHSSYRPTVEKMWLGRVERTNNTFYVSKIYIAPQTKNSSAYVETDDERLPAWVIDKDPSTLRLHGHSHPKMSPTPSITDERMFQQLIDEEHDFFLRIIVSDLGDYYLDMFIDEYKTIYEDIQYYIELIPNGVYAKVINDNIQLITIKGFKPNYPINYHELLESLEYRFNVEEELKEWISVNTYHTSTLYPYQSPYTSLDAEQSEAISLYSWDDLE